jgi:hypothetical protein
MTLGTIQRALLGVQQQQRRFERAADEVVRATLPGEPEQPPTGGASGDAPDLVQASTRLLSARQGLQACLAVADRADEMLGSVIDMLA